MKKLLFIFIFFISLLKGQVNPPDLRCISVLNSGDVQLTWIPPADPGNFNSYDVYFSALRNGPYNVVSTGLNTLNQTTFVHTSTVALVQTCYYFMVAKAGPGGATVSGNSDTLRTIFLNPIGGNQTLDIRFTQIHTPKLASSADLYTIIKQYPYGVSNNLASISGTVYPDTITICYDTIRYQVTLLDKGIGCLSSSNPVKGVYSNSKDPEQPYVDSISVLPNGTTLLTWKIPIDKDIDSYVIQYLSGSINTTIDIVPGRNSTSYVYMSPTATFSSVGVFVQARDSCGRRSIVDYGVRTMFLQTNYNNCAYQAELKWNRYYWPNIKGTPVEALGKYWIYYSVNGSAFTKVGETTDTNFVHPGVAPGKNICYYVRVVNNRQPMVTASSNRSCFFSDQVNAPKFIYLSTASVLDKSFSELRIYMDTSSTCKGIEIQRSDNGTDFKPVGFIPYANTQHYLFIDENIQTTSKSYFYKAVVIDNCGNFRDPSNVSKTILLKIHEDEGQLFTKHLSWTAYQGFNGGVSGYNIYRVVNDDLGTALVGSTDALTTTYTDNLENAAPQGAKIEYLVQAVEGIGNVYGIFQRSSSNPAPVYMEGNIYVPNAFAPSGINSSWLPITHFVEKTDYHVSVFNRWGKKVFETNDDKKSWDGENCIADVYVYLIDYKNARGEYLQINGTVLLLR